MIPYYIVPGLTSPVNELVPSLMTEDKKINRSYFIIEAVAKYFKEDIVKVYSKSRKRELVIICQISCYLINQEFPKLKLVTVASLFGSRYAIKSGFSFDHAAVIFNVKKCRNLMSVNDSIKDDIEMIMKLI